jgi:hypothetical protein
VRSCGHFGYGRYRFHASRQTGTAAGYLLPQLELSAVTQRVLRPQSGPAFSAYCKGRRPVLSGRLPQLQVEVYG